MPSAADFEKLGVFYLGHPYDWQQKKGQDGAMVIERRPLPEMPAELKAIIEEMK